MLKILAVSLVNTFLVLQKQNNQFGIIIQKRQDCIRTVFGRTTLSVKILEQACLDYLWKQVILHLADVFGTDLVQYKPS